MTTTLKNSYIDRFNEKLKIYDSIFFKSIDGSGILLAEASSITEPNGMRIPTNTNATTYSAAQFTNFIRNIVNFNIKNFHILDDKDNNMGFVKKTMGRNGTPAYTLNENVKTNIIETLKVVNVFVDILEAYKYCIDNKEKDTIFDTGYTTETPINRIEIVSGKTRFYNADNTVMTPASTVLNAGYIRSVKEYDGADASSSVLYLSIQSFNTGMTDKIYNYNNIFDKKNDNAVFNSSPSNILNAAAKGTILEPYPLAIRDYPRQVYSGIASDPTSISNLTLENRNKALVKLLLKTLFTLDINFRSQSVYALYYYYKFVQLYSSLIINVSNVMYADLNEASPPRIETRNTTTSKKALGVSGIELIMNGIRYNSAPTITVTGGGGTITAGTNIVAETGGKVNINNGGSGYTSTPQVSVQGSLSSGTVQAQAIATIAPVVMEYSRTESDNIEKLKDVISEVSNALSELITDVSNYTKNTDTSFVISTATAPTDLKATMVSFNPDNKIVLNITNGCIYRKLSMYSAMYDIPNDYTVYDNKNKVYYNIIRINNEDQNIFKIEINAVFTADDILEKDIDTKIFKDGVGDAINKPVDDAPVVIPTTNANFLEIRRKDINAYKTEYIYNRNDLDKLNENIGYNTSKVTHQTNQYETQFNKNVFLERQILAYNIILAIILVVLVGINVVNIDKQLVKTISLSCLGTIVLLFIIYFISNITYIETFALTPTDALYSLTKANYGDKTKKLNPSSYNTLKLNTIKNEVDKLNSKFISYFEKIIITLPSTDNLDFYREIKDVITNDRDNKQFINKRLEYNKSQNSNDINSLKYELENNKLYINTLLISAIIFVGLYNLYINYATNDKYLSLLIFVSVIIFIVILAYYIITSNRRVKTVFKNVYWGPEFSKRF
jgi:hypothetical protein